MILNVTPMLAVADIDASVAFVRDTLGFRVGWQDEGYAYLFRDSGAIRFVQAPPGTDMDDPARQVSVYVDVADVDAFYAENRAALDALPEGLFRAPFDQAYGQRELHVIHGPILFFFGQTIKRQP